MKVYLKYFCKLKTYFFPKKDFQINNEFEKNNIPMCIQRAKLFNIAVIFMSFYNFYFDFILSKHIDNIAYKKTLLIIHIVVFILSIVYFIILKSLDKLKNPNYFKTARILLITDMFVTIFLAALTSLNSQRFSGNIDIYIMNVILIALIVPIYPRIMFLNYFINHIFFLISLPFFTNNHAMIVLNTINSTLVVLMASILFIIMYGYNKKNYLNDKKLNRDKLTFKKLFDLNPFPLLVSKYDDGKIIDANDKALKLYNMTKEDFTKLNYNSLYKNESDLSKVINNLEKYEVLQDYLVELKVQSGEIKWALINYKLIDYFGVKSILSGIADITEIKRLEDKLKLLSSVDTLTGMLNRRAGMEVLTNKIENLKAINAQFSICFCDIDNLKFVNDRFGHTEGDLLITLICKTIGEEISSSDTIFRYGGDEFIIIFENNNNIHEICTNIKNKFIDLNKTNIKPYLINASLGLFSYTSDMNLSINEIIEQADKEMYKNKIASQA